MVRAASRRFSNRCARISLLGTCMLGLSAPAYAALQSEDTAADTGYSAAINTLRQQAEQGDAEAQYNLGQAYLIGRGVPKDQEMAESWLAKSARQGNSDAIESYGLILFRNDHQAEAMPYIEAAAARGQNKAQYILGIAHFNGDLARQDWVRAYAMMILAAEGGLPQAELNLGTMDRYIPIAERQEGLRLARKLEIEIKERNGESGENIVASAPREPGPPPVQTEAQADPVATSREDAPVMETQTEAIEPAETTIEVAQLPPSSAATDEIVGAAETEEDTGPSQDMELAGTAESETEAPDEAADPEETVAEETEIAEPILDDSANMSEEDQAPVEEDAPPAEDTDPPAAEADVMPDEETESPEPVSEDAEASTNEDNAVSETAETAAETEVPVVDETAAEEAIPEAAVPEETVIDEADEPVESSEFVQPIPADASDTGPEPAEGQTATWRVQLGAFRTQEKVEAVWEDLKSRHDILSDLQVFYEDAGEFKRLQAGPFANKSDAAKLCKALNGKACFVVEK